jgi:hypothetical protein
MAPAVRLLSFQDPAEVALPELGTRTQGSAATSSQNIRRAEIWTTTGGRIACEVNALGRVSPWRARGILGCRPTLFIVDRWRRSGSVGPERVMICRSGGSDREIPPTADELGTTRERQGGARKRRDVFAPSVLVRRRLTGRILDQD